LFVAQALSAYGTSTVLVMDAVSWEEFEASDKDMAEHVRQRLTYAPCYLATVRPDGFPRVHPVGVHVRDGELVVPMNPDLTEGCRHQEERTRCAALCRRGQPRRRG
jgi:hypothetical protein